NAYQIERIMRLSIVLFIITTNLITNSFANTTYAQETQISIHVENINIKEVFREIERKSDFVIFVFDKDIDSKRKVSANIENQTIDKILDIVLKGSGNEYVIEDKQVFITKKQNADTAAASPNPQQVPEQIDVKGKVIDESGNPLPGVNVIVQGSTRG